MNSTAFYITSTFLSFKNSLSLTLVKNFNKYIHFNYNFLLISPFYWVRYLNILRYGLKGISPTLGFGNHKLNNYWFYNFLSQFLFYKTGYLFYIISSITLLISLTFVLYSVQEDILYILGILLIFIGSKVFHKFTFVCQNYNALGWAFSPLFFYALQTQEYFYAGLSLLFISCLSFTTTILISPFALCFCFEQNTYLPLLSVIPTLIKIFILIVYSSGFTKIKNTILYIAKAIGFTKKNTKYILDKDKFKRKHILYFHILFQIYIFCVTYSVNYFFLLFTLLVLANFYLARFCDEQSLDILSFIILFHYAVNQLDLDFFIIILLFFLLNFSFIQIYDNSLIKKPISATPFLKAFESFFKPIQENSKVFLCFTDPQNKYENLFDKQRYLLDYPLYCATIRNIHLFPEYTTVCDSNFPNSPNIWADNPKDTQVLLEEYKTSYCIVSQSTESELSVKWSKAGFSVVNIFDWGTFLNENKIDRSLWWFGMPKWFLLKKA